MALTFLYKKCTIGKYLNLELIQCSWAVLIAQTVGGVPHGEWFSLCFDVRCADTPSIYQSCRELVILEGGRSEKQCVTRG
jgi:hypothetical protein